MRGCERHVGCRAVIRYKLSSLGDELSKVELKKLGRKAAKKGVGLCDLIAVAVDSIWERCCCLSELCL